MKSVRLFVLGVSYILMHSMYSQSIGEQTTKEMTEVFTKSKLAGLGLTMLNNDSVQYEKGLGYADISSKTIYDISTVQNIGSISKPE